MYQRKNIHKVVHTPKYERCTYEGRFENSLSSKLLDGFQLISLLSEIVRSESLKDCLIDKFANLLEGIKSMQMLKLNDEINKWQKK